MSARVRITVADAGSIFDSVLASACATHTYLPSDAMPYGPVSAGSLTVPEIVAATTSIRDNVLVPLFVTHT